MTWLFRLFDLIRGPTVFEPLWRLFTGAGLLTEKELAAASSVLGSDTIMYGSVRMAEGGLLRLVFRLNGGRAFTTFHTINLPGSGHHARSKLEIVVHELVHVYQFERVGSEYIWQALRAQRAKGYKYGGWAALVEDRCNGKRLCDYNREQQGQIAQDYYRDVVEKALPSSDPVRLAYEPFIDDLRRGDL